MLLSRTLSRRQRTVQLKTWSYCYVLNTQCQWGSRLSTRHVQRLETDVSPRWSEHVPITVMPVASTRQFIQRLKEQNASHIGLVRWLVNWIRMRIAPVYVPHYDGWIYLSNKTKVFSIETWVGRQLHIIWFACRFYIEVIIGTVTIKIRPTCMIIAS